MVTDILADVVSSGNGTNLNTTTLTYPAGIAAGDHLFIVGLFGGLTGSANTTGTGITGPAGYTEETGQGSPHEYSSTMAIRVWRKIAAGTESGNIPITWGGGTAASRTHWQIIAVPAAYTFQGIVWN